MNLAHSMVLASDPPPKTSPVAKRVKRHGLLRSLGGRRAAQGAAWPLMVVVVAPVVHDAPDVSEPPEPVLVQAAVPELAVEALHESVLGGLAGLDEVQGRAGPLAPKAHRLAGRLGAVVADDGLGMRRGLAQLVQEERQPGPRDRGGHQLADARPGGSRRRRRGCASAGRWPAGRT